MYSVGTVSHLGPVDMLVAAPQQPIPQVVEIQCNPPEFPLVTHSSFPGDAISTVSVSLKYHNLSPRGWCTSQVIVEAMQQQQQVD